MRYRNLAVLAAVVALVAPAMADFSGSPMPVQLNRYWGYYSGNGGEFTITPSVTLRNVVRTGTYSDLASGDSWQTFCIERNEYVNTPGNYYADINTFATMGGAGGSDGNAGPNGESSDTLDSRTAYLYQNFRNGTLQTGYDYTGWHRDDDACALQNAIWYIEGELTSLWGKARDLYNEAVEATEIGSLYGYGQTDGNATWAGLGNVRVLNMWGNTDRTSFKQDQLVLVNPVPVPGAALLGVFGLAAIGWVKRRVA